MKTAPSCRTSALIETLECRCLLSAAPHPAIVADAAKVSVATKTTISAQAGSLGQGVTFTTTVRDTAANGAPAGTVTLSTGGSTITTVTLAPATSTSSKFDLSSGTFTLPAGAGGPAPYFGSYSVTATFASSGSLAASHASTHFTVKKPKFTKESGGLEVATVEAGTGPAIAAGQTASMLYTGYLFKGGAIFDDSDNHPPVAPFQFTVEASPEQVITGFDEGTIGMTVGETRVLVIPSALGYGPQGSPPAIPANAELVFLITLEGIS
jgi:FKBP-type peptidyl-prolyl cis-trans isomerase FkpA